MAKIETIFIPDNLNPIVENERYPTVVSSPKSVNIEKKCTSKEKVGEIFQLSPDHFAFVCIHCGEDFLVLVQFTAHINRHLSDNYSNEIAYTSVKEEPTEDISEVKPDEMKDDELSGLLTSSCLDSDNDNIESKKWWEFEEEKNSSLDNSKTQASYYCPECSRSFSRRSNLRRHLKLHNPQSNQTCICTMCNSKFTQQRYLREHVREKHRDMDYYHECTICNAKFKYTYEYSQHIAAHEEEQCVMRKTKGNLQVECYRCHSILSSLEICREHLKTHYTNALYCTKCKRFFTKEKYFRRHEAKCSSTETFDCDKCSATFKRHSILSKHRRTEHGTPRYYRPKSSETRILNCDQCQQQFLDASLYRRHLRAHKKESNIKPFKCHICGFEFLERGNLNRHLARHAGERDFTCKYCNKSFPKDYRSEHLRTHTGQKDHQCPQCGKQFISGGSLKRHMVCHSQERKYKCNMCPKSYARSDKLLAHIRGRFYIPINCL